MTEQNHDPEPIEVYTPEQELPRNVPGEIVEFTGPLPAGPLPEIDPDNPGEERTTADPVDEAYNTDARVGIRDLQEGMAGDDVRFVQAYIGPAAGQVDGWFGPQTAKGVRWYQAARGIDQNSVVDARTWYQMLDRKARAQGTIKRHPLHLGDGGSEVIELQRALNREPITYRLAVDGRYGAKTEAAVIQVQHNLGVARTGKATKAVHEALDY